MLTPIHCFYIRPINFPHSAIGAKRYWSIPFTLRGWKASLRFLTVFRGIGITDIVIHCFFLHPVGSGQNTTLGVLPSRCKTPFSIRIGPLHSFQLFSLDRKVAKRSPLEFWQSILFRFVTGGLTPSHWLIAHLRGASDTSIHIY
jgi:hypothetical protein